MQTGENIDLSWISEKVRACAHGQLLSRVPHIWRHAKTPGPFYDLWLFFPNHHRLVSSAFSELCALLASVAHFRPHTP